ncbi:MAG: RagB/SusD family nutrient uptake outer membrane protein [Bacteroidota bacterium]
MKQISTRLLVLSALLSLTACTDIEENLVGEITEWDESIVENWGSGPVSTVPNIYHSLRGTGTADHGGYFTLQEVTSDEMFIGVKGNDWTSNGSLASLHRHTWTPNSSNILSTWRITYSAINAVNEQFENDWLDEEEVPQARALRAYYYWRLLDLYGRVKLVTDTAANPPQSSRQEVFDFVEQELLGALGIAGLNTDIDLSNSTLPADQPPHTINCYVALGLLAKLYLNAEVYTGVPRYEEALIAANYIIDSGYYQLCDEGCRVINLGRRIGVPSDPEYLEGYPAVFAPNNEGNAEHIFTIRYDETTNIGMHFAQMNLHSSSQMSWHLDEQPWNGYATVEAFYNSYDTGDLRHKASFLVGPQVDFTGSALLDYQSDDDNVELNYTPEVNELAPNTLREAGARAAKFSFKLYGKRSMENDFPILRLGEIYLIRAEAKARLSNNWAAAEPDVNILRGRAGMPTYSGTLTAEEFLAERGREMFQETARRTDLIRFGKFNDAWWEKQVSAAYRNVFPIPQVILDTDPNMTQNPGY